MNKLNKIVLSLTLALGVMSSAGVVSASTGKAEPRQIKIVKVKGQWKVMYFKVWKKWGNK